MRNNTVEVIVKLEKGISKEDVQRIIGVSQFMPGAAHVTTRSESQIDSNSIYLALSHWSDELRKGFFVNLTTFYCEHCGGVQPKSSRPCQCCNDD